MRWIAAVLASVVVLAPTSAFAIFPPVIQQQPTVSITGVKSSPAPVVKIQGGQTPPPVTTTAATPEPSTIVTGLISLALGGLLLRKKKPVQMA
jgi:hypothetical protein